MKSESNILAEIRLALSPRARLFRQQVGRFWTEDHRPVYVGMKGTPDLIGYTIVDGRGIYTAIEVKSEIGRVRPEQKMFIDAVIKNGGLAGVARSVEDALIICGLDKK